MIRRSALLLAFFCTSALASDWRVTYFKVGRGYLLVDRESVVEINKATRKFWTLFTPMVPMDKMGEGYAYRKVLHVTDCQAHTTVTTASIYTDELGKDHDSEVRDTLHDIVPDSEDAFLMQYVCNIGNADEEKKLVGPPAGVSDLLEGQIRSTRENIVRFRQR